MVELAHPTESESDSKTDERTPARRERRDEWSAELAQVRPHGTIHQEGLAFASSAVGGECTLPRAVGGVLVYARSSAARARTVRLLVQKLRSSPNSMLSGWFLTGMLPARVVTCGVEAHKPVERFARTRRPYFGAARRYVDPELAKHEHRQRDCHLVLVRACVLRIRRMVLRILRAPAPLGHEFVEVDSTRERRIGKRLELRSDLPVGEEIDTVFARDDGMGQDVV